jgi:predicted phosphodiesterase
MTINDLIALPWLRWTVPFSTWLEHVEGRIRMWFQRKDIMRIGVVGDLSMQEPKRLDRVLKKALANTDLVVQLGDMHAAYNVIEKHLKTGRLLVIPGNHDDRYDTLGLPRQWIQKKSTCTLVGLDNANDHFNAETWQLLGKVNDCKRPLLVFAHKPVSNITLPDGSENTHVMGESGDPASAVAARNFQDWMRGQEDVLLISGHWHGWTYQKTTYGDVLVEGRGGAAPQLGYTIITITPEGLVFHAVNLD